MKKVSNLVSSEIFSSTSSSESSSDDDENQSDSGSDDSESEEKGIFCFIVLYTFSCCFLLVCYCN
jgi:hypothetical protein